MSLRPAKLETGSNPVFDLLQKWWHPRQNLAPFNFFFITISINRFSDACNAHLQILPLFFLAFQSANIICTPKKCPYFPIELQSSLGIIRPWAGPTWWPPIAMSPPLYRCLITATMESQKRVSPQAIGLWYDLVKFSIFSKPDPSGFYRGQKETNSNSQMTCSLRKSIQVKNHGDHSGF